MTALDNETHGQLFAQVNGSGFPFQMALAQTVRGSQLGWSVVGEEVPWCLGTDSGYIDLVLQRNGPLRAVVECKRHEGRWVFLIPRGLTGADPVRAYSVRACWAHSLPEGVIVDWPKMAFGPTGPEASFAIRDRNRPALEMESDILVRATEALARNEMALPGPSRSPHTYIPLLVTTASLYVGVVDLDTIPLEDGKIPIDGIEFRSEPWVRFVKATGIRGTGLSAGGGIGDALEAAQRTTLVVSAAHVEKFLQTFSHAGPMPGHLDPFV